MDVHVACAWAGDVQSTYFKYAHWEYARESAWKVSLVVNQCPFANIYFEKLLKIKVVTKKLIGFSKIFLNTNTQVVLLEKQSFVTYGRVS